MNDQKHGQQGHHFIKQIEGHQIARQTNADQGTLGQQIEPEESGLMPLMGHVLIGIEGHDEPDDGYHHGK